MKARPALLPPGQDLAASLRVVVSFRLSQGLCCGPLPVSHELPQRCRLNWIDGRWPRPNRVIALRSQRRCASDLLRTCGHMAGISPPLLLYAQPPHLASGAARGLSTSASELEDRPSQQECQSTDENCWPGSEFAPRIRQASTIGFGEDGPYQGHFLLRLSRLMVLRIATAHGRGLPHGQIRSIRKIGRVRSNICRRPGGGGLRGCALCGLHLRRYCGRHCRSILARRPRR